jgi:hypothetical protein
VIHAVEEFSDIAFQNETVGRTIPAYATGFLLQNINAFMRAKSDPAGKGCGDKSFLKDRIQHRKYGVMQNAVADFSLMDMPLFWIGSVEAVIFFKSRWSWKRFFSICRSNSTTSVLFFLSALNVSHAVKRFSTEMIFRKRSR